MAQDREQHQADTEVEVTEQLPEVMEQAREQQVVKLPQAATEHLQVVRLQADTELHPAVKRSQAATVINPLAALTDTD